MRPLGVKIDRPYLQTTKRELSKPEPQEKPPEDVVSLSGGKETKVGRPLGQVPTGAIAAAVPGPIGASLALLSRALDPNDVDAWDRAEAYYDKVRKCPDDVSAIARNTPYSERQIDTVKNHLFINTHQLDEGVRRFDADPLIANAWSRLQEGSHRPGDLQLMEHELFEARFEALFDTDYRTAHEAADRSGRPSGLYA